MLSVVSKKEFYDYIGPRDILVRAEYSADPAIGCYCNFKTRGGQLVGRVYDKPTKQYLLCESVQNGKSPK